MKLSKMMSVLMAAAVIFTGSLPAAVKASDEFSEYVYDLDDEESCEPMPDYFPEAE
ncbi:MAG: hypothetical protein IKT17_10865 [Lachnospiraceae bacterium]|nr:hypothetical protein [Lachnospiraceae bacterium]